MKLYNTLGRQIQQFQPLKEGEVSLYTCGPTVYDYAHIGNWRSFVFDDTLRRVLESEGYKVKHVMNITDVGHLTSDADEGRDKLEAGAESRGSSVWDVAEHFIEIFIKDSEKLNILPPNGYKENRSAYARATDFIDEQIGIVKILLDKGFAYKTDEAIYFEVSKLDSYGKLSGQKLEDKEVGAREDVVTDANKRHPQDFALWFFTVGRFAGHEMKWHSPWGTGFPGWHLECSAIIHATLGDPIDIHTGGVDHIGTHHANEMAQTEAAFGNKLANFWVHNEHMLVDGKKMSKSLGNYITLEEVLKRGYAPADLRLLYLQAHYRSQMNFSWEALTAASVRLKGYRAFADLRFQPGGESALKNEAYIKIQDEINQALADDISTPKALSLLDALAEQAQDKGSEREPLVGFLKFIDNALGLELLASEDINTQQKRLIHQREQARAIKDWKESDALREALNKQGLDINDTSRGPVWSRG